MSDTIKGVTFEITAEDKTQTGTEAAISNLNKAKKAEENAVGQAKKEAGDAKTLFESVTQAISGNFSSLAVKIAEVATRMKGVQISGLALGAIGAIVTSIVTIVKSLADSWKRVKEKIEDIRLKNVLSGVSEFKTEIEAVSDRINTARENAELIKNVIEGQVDATKKLKDAQLEYAKAQELSIAKTDEERALIEEKYKSQGRMTDMEYAARKRQLQRSSADNEIRSIEDEIEAAKEKERGALLGQSDMMSQIRRRLKNAETLRGEAGLRNTEAIERIGEKREEYGQIAMEAIREQQKLKVKLEAARKRRKTLDVEEQAAQISDKATLLNDNTESDRKSAAEIKKIKADTERIKDEIDKARKEKEKLSIEDAERIARSRAKAELEATRQIELAQKKAHDRRRKDLEEEVKVLSMSSEAANQRLAAARAAVQQAWGWYRDKDSMKARLDEEKADAEAQKQFEKDFEKLTYRRDWRTAKNLSVDQEAVRRVGVAREEEAAAKRAAAETAANTARAAEELARIREAVTEEA